ncbi:MAG: hypothetical protein ABJO01_08265 [Parasphingorhabdus sp.]|uniref:hypothetical protein n=1 Tax=Parasphingorhabdus sp. TaxID=2709688 RepID=UPI0032978964
MSQSQLLITTFPLAEDQPLHWWLVIDGHLDSKGCDKDPLLASGLKLPASQTEDWTHIALVPSATAVVRWHAPPQELTELQSLAAARLAVQEASLDLDNLHIAALADGNGQVATAAASRSAIGEGLSALNGIGLDPDFIVPAGWIVSPQPDSVMAADFGFEKLLRGEQIISPDEPALREYLLDGADIVTLSDDLMAQNMAAAGHIPMLNLRSGAFAKKVNRKLSTRQRQTLAWLALAALVLSILIPVVQLVKLHWATAETYEAALATAEPIVGSVDTVAEADRLLNEMLIRENRGNITLSVPASALFSAIQQTQGVSIDRISYRKDGTVFAGLTAVRNEDMNPALVALQNAGFIITATPRTDATGASKADITVRAP